MRTALAIATQIASLCVIWFLGRFAMILLLRLDVGTNHMGWLAHWGALTYSAASGCLLLVGIAACIFGGQPRANQIVVAENMVGAKLLKIWLWQNVFVALMSLTGFSLALADATPQMREVMLRHVFHW